MLWGPGQNGMFDHKLPENLLYSEGHVEGAFKMKACSYFRIVRYRFS